MTPTLDRLEVDDAVAAVPGCGTHPEAPAVGTCRRCGTFVCDRCLRPETASASLCVHCDERQGRVLSRRTVWALALGCFAFLGGVPGVIALFLAWQEERSISLGEANADALPWLRITRRIVWAEWVALLVCAGLVWGPQK